MKNLMRFRIQISLWAIIFLMYINHATVAQNCYQTALESGEGLAYHYISGSGKNFNEASGQVLKQLAAQGFVAIGFNKKSLKIITSESRIDSLIENYSVEFEKKTYQIVLLEKQYKKGIYCVLYAKIDPSTNYKRKPGRLSSGHFIWRSIIPSWGQFYNRETAKGIFFSVGELTLLSGALISFNQVSKQEGNADLALLTGDLANFNRFNQRGKNWRTAGRIFTGGAIALWVLNLIDATASPKIIYALLNQQQVSLFATNNGIGLQYKF